MERKEAIEIVRKLYNDSLFLKKDKEAMVTLIPELAESEGERIRKELISHFDDLYHDNIMELPSMNTIESWIAWLEKQREQKSIDKVAPKFNVGDKIISTISNIPYYITEVCNGHYLTDVGCIIMFNAQNNFELSNQNSTWSEEDENILKLSIKNLTELKDRFGEEYGKVGDCIVWHESIKDRIQPQNWKPSDEQLNSLYDVLNPCDGFDKELLESLYDDLKKLKGE